jgi:hypothetical protein
MDEDAPMPAAYYETLETFREWPETLNIQGVNDFGPNAPMDYALEHCPEPRPKRQRWVNDSSVNLEYYSAADAQEALLALTHPEAGDAKAIPAQTSRKARYYSQNPDSDLVVREANTGDQKQRNAADRSEYYKKNPQIREQKPKRRERTPPPIFLDYGDEEGETRNSRGRSSDEGMYDSGEDTRARRSGNYRNGGGNRNGGRDRGRLVDREVDSYRPSENGYSLVLHAYSSLGEKLTFIVLESPTTGACETAPHLQVLILTTAALVSPKMAPRSTNATAHAAVTGTIDDDGAALLNADSKNATLLKQIAGRKTVVQRSRPIKDDG